MTTTKKVTNPIRKSDKQKFEIDSYISSKDNVVRGDADNTLGSVLPLVLSSHSPIFIYDSDDEFIGLVSPYQALYSGSYPYTTKLTAIAKSPPHMTNGTQLYEVASRMLESRVYTLPIFDQDKQIVGLITSKEIFQNLIQDQDMLSFISSTLDPRKPVTATHDATVGDIFQIMKDKQVSRVVLVDDNGLLTGIVSRKDFHNAFMKPTNKQRFGKNGLQSTDRAFDNEKEYRKDDKIIKYATKLVYTLPRETAKEEIIKQLIASPHNSVVLVDKYKKPISFVSMRDILSGLASLRPVEEINLIMTKPDRNVSNEDIEQVEETLIRFGRKISKQIELDQIEITFEAPTTPVGGSIIFNTVLLVSPVTGDMIVSKTKNRSFIDGVHEAIAQIEKQLRRSDN